MTQELGEDEREIELSSIAAIYPELVLGPDDPFVASIDVAVAPASPIRILCPSAPVDGAPPDLPTPPSSDHSDNAKKPGPIPHNTSDVHELSYLPPLHLQVTLPDGYPADQPPKFQLSTSPSWLPDTTLQRLIEEGNPLWEEYGRCQVVFAYIDLLQQAAERGFDTQNSPSGYLEVPSDLKIALLDFDTKAKRERFEQETFECGVCLEPKKGSSCYRLLRCGHVFCVPCLRDFYNNCITEGDVSSVKCLAPDCGKPQSAQKRKSGKTLNPSELLQIPLEEPMVKRYVELKRKKKLESDKSTVYCPRKWCQGPARSKKYPKVTDVAFAEDSDLESDDAAPTYDKNTDESKLPPPAERLSICEDCNYAFCRVCLSGWHGEFARCWPRTTAELTAEEKASYDYIRLHTTPCPTCSSPCQKTHGCNHMNCFQCHTHFCYLCSAWLDPGNPYQHFNNPKIGCFQRLWELEEGDEGEGNVRFEGARGWEVAIAAAEEADAAPAVPQPPPVAPPVQAQVQRPPPPVPAPLVAADVDDVQLIAMMQQHIVDEAADPHWLQDFQEELEAFQRDRAARTQQERLQERVQEQQVLLMLEEQRQVGRDRQQQQRQQQQQQQQQHHGRRRGGHGAGRGGIAERGRGRGEPVQVRQRQGQMQGPEQRPGQGQGHGQGLRRFLDMVERDEEDEWDSDELEEDDQAFVIPER